MSFLLRVVVRMCLVMPMFFAIHDVYAQTAAKLIQQGDRYFQQFDTEKAYESYKEAAALDSTNFDALWKMTDALIDLGDELPKSPDQKQLYQEARLVAARAIELNPNHYRGHAAMALSLDRLSSTVAGSDRVGLLNQMRIEAEKCLKLNETCSVAFWTLGKWHREISNTAWLTKTWSRLFGASFPTASLPDAIAYLEKSCDLDDSTIVYRLDLGKTLVFTEDWARVETEFGRVLEMRPLRKNDQKHQRDAGRYLEWLSAKRFSDLRDAVEEY